MKHARTTLVILFLFVTPLLLSGVTPMIPDRDVLDLTSPTPTKVSVLSYEIHGPIDIDNDTDFYNTAEAENWDGDGSPGDPYIIEGYSIASAGTCITISDVTYSFEIRGCYLTSEMLHDGDGVDINNATDVVIVNTTIVIKTYTMVLVDIDSLEVRNCTTDYCEYGLYIWESEGAIVEHCVVTGIYFDCLRLYLCNNSVVTGNRFLDPVQGTGVRVLLSHHVTIFGCEISGCADSGIYAADSTYLTVEECDIYDNWYFFVPLCGIYLHNADYASIVGNEIYHNARNGIFIQGSDFAHVFDNNIYDNSDHGIDVISSNNGTIIQNDIHSNGWWPIVVNALCGVYLGGETIDWVVSDNMIWNNTPCGITVELSERIEITSNQIYNNTDAGIYAFTYEADSEVNIRENEVYGNGGQDTAPTPNAGIYLSGYVDCIIEGNVVYNNSNNGISVQSGPNSILGNTVYDTGGPGAAIEVIMAIDCLVSGNIAYDSAAGILIYAINTNVTHNIIYDNEVGINLYGSHLCNLYGNDIGWNDQNALQQYGMPNNMWYNNVTDVGNWWGDWNGTGVYNIYNGTHPVSADMFPSKSLDLGQASSIDFEILETGNTVVWLASALNPSHYEVFVDGSSFLTESWDGEDIEYLADGLSHGVHTISVEVYHISGHSIGNSTSADVEDLTPPHVEGPTAIQTTVGGFFNVQYTATDPSALGTWSVNNTDFAISTSGVLSRVGDLIAGEYIILIEISDLYGNTGSLIVHVYVTSVGLPAEMVLLIGGGVIAGLVVLVVILKKKKT